ncbi:MAG: hypothetical protein P8Z00_15430 [Anaerolineales bacterium]
MQTPKARWFTINLTCLLAMLLSACGSGAAVSTGTATAQAQRARAMATQMALNLKATDESQAQVAHATQQAVQTLWGQSQGWPAVIDDGFDQNNLDWPEGDDTDPLAVINWKIEAGKFLWRATANDSFVWWVYPTMDPVTDFSLSVQVQQTGGAVDGEGGLIYRVQEPGQYYTFELNGMNFYQPGKRGFAGRCQHPEWDDRVVDRTITGGGPGVLGIRRFQAQRANFANHRNTLTRFSSINQYKK